MMEDEQAMSGTKNKDGEEAERGSRGVKRPAEEEARGGQDADAGSLRIAPSAKRHKTDAEWGMSLRPNVYAAKADVSLACSTGCRHAIQVQWC